MKIIKAALIGASMLFLAACSTTNHGDAEAPLVRATPAQVEELETKVGDRVFFAFDMYSLSQEAQNTLSNQAEFMKQNPDLSFVIEGHADERGTREYNLALGERRANAAKDFLVNLGVSPSRLTVISYGKERPAVLGANEWAWSQNRRAVTAAK